MLAILPFTSALAFDFEVNGIYYNYLSETNIEVTSGTNKYAGDVIIPNSVENNGIVYKIIKIGNRAFYGCTEITSIEIPSSVVTIGGSAFQNCALKDIQIPNSVDSIAASAFAKCNELKDVVIGSGVRKIVGSFNGSDNITSVSILSATPPTINTRTTFSSKVLYNATLEVPMGSLEAYQNAGGWKNFKNIVEGNTPISNAISINVWNFPDAKFRKFLLNESYGKDSIITNDEFANITSLDVSNRRISDLKGIEHFTALNKLLCHKNKLSWVNLSANKNLTELDCYSNQIMGIKMDSLIASLPTLSNDEGSLYVYDATEDYNICCEKQVSEVVAKGWIVFYYTGTDWQQYTGHENGIVIDEYNFPDENFCAYLKKLNFGWDGFITDDEIKNLTLLEVGWPGNVSNLKGIEYFTELTTLSCYNNILTSLDVSKNTALTTLNCQYNQLTSLDISKNVALTSLNCSNNQLTSIDVSKSTALTDLNCFHNQLTSLDVSKNTALTTLNCSSNQLTSLDVSKNTALTSLVCSSNQLTSIDVSKNKTLTELSCINNQLTSLDISKNTALTELLCSKNLLTSLDVSKNTALTSLACYNNQLANLDVSKNTTLESLYCRSNQLTSLDVSKNTAMTYLECSYNQLTTLDLSKNTAMTSLSCYYNQLVSIDVSKCTALVSLFCNNNQLTTLDLSKNTTMRQLDCSNNQLTSLEVSICSYLHCQNNLLTDLDMSKNINLYELYCYDNQLTSLDLSKNTELKDLDCSNNQITSLDISGCTRLNRLLCFNNLLMSLDISNNTGLTGLNCSYNKLANLDMSHNTAITILHCENNLLTSLDVSKNTALTGLFCFDNKIKGEAMDALVGSLPNQASALMNVIDLSNSSEENVCTTIQVSVAKGKGWRVLTSSGDDYEGSEPTSIQSIILDKETKAPVYDLNGRKIKEPNKGINIVGGKKLLVK